jgi:carboxylesterase
MNVNAQQPIEERSEGRAGVFLIHGLDATEYDLGSMHTRLKLAGFVTHSLTLPGHGTRPEDLLGVTAEDWLEACRARYRELAAEYETLHLI